LDAPAPNAPLPVERLALPELTALCLLAGADVVEREDSFTDIAFDYYAQTNECRARRLVSAMGDTQSGEWLNYLINYSHALFGCGLLYSPLPGGVDAFGPANTEAVGIPNLTFAAEDAALLIDIYMNSCTNELPVPGADIAELRARLAAAAQPNVDANQTVRISECP
jgi:hypothetical protein